MTVSLEEFKKRLYDKHGDNIVLLEFAGFKKGKSLFQCKKCNYQWSVKACGVSGGSGCSQCAREKDKLNIDYVKKYIESFGCEYISGEYKNAFSKLNIKFLCGHIDTMIWHEFQCGRHMCCACGIKIRSDKHRTKESDIINFLKENGFEFIGFDGEYKRQRETFVLYKCPLGHVTRRAVMNIYKYKTCKECKRIKLKELHMGILNKMWNGGITSFRNDVSNQLGMWKYNSIIACEGKCIITGGKFHHIHHLYSYNLIIRETLKEFGVVEKKIKNCTPEETHIFAEMIAENHKKYPLGVCLDKEIHALFHKIYGRGNNTPNQWFDFNYKIKNNLLSID